jgi:Ca2+-binding RTX toxin-like protein
MADIAGAGIIADTGLDDIITGSAGIDTFTGGGGNDTIDGSGTGGGDIDVAVYAHNRFEYAVFYLGPGRWTVIDLNADNQNEDRDLLVNIESVRFQDVTLTDAIESTRSLGFVGTGGFAAIMAESWGPLLDPATGIIPPGPGTWTGTANAERFTGNDGVDIAYGLGGNDYLETGSDNYFLYGGSEDDFLDGGNGLDTAYGAG